MKNLLTNISQEEKNRILEMHSGMKKTIKEKYDDFNDDEQSRVNDLKQKHGIKFRGDFDGDDDEWMDYMSDNTDSFDNFRKDNNRINIPTDPIVFDPTDDDTSQLKQKHGVTFRDEYEGDDDEIMDYLYDNKDSFDNFSRENKRTKKSTSTEPTDDETSQLKQRHGVKFRDEFDDDDAFMDYIQNNRDSFDNLSKDLNDLRQTKRNR